jgi:hypothetical protein
MISTKTPDPLSGHISVRLSIAISPLNYLSKVFQRGCIVTLQPEYVHGIGQWRIAPILNISVNAHALSAYNGMGTRILANFLVFMNQQVRYIFPDALHLV